MQACAGGGAGLHVGKGGGAGVCAGMGRGCRDGEGLVCVQG